MRLLAASLVVVALAAVSALPGLGAGAEVAPAPPARLSAAAAPAAGCGAVRATFVQAGALDAVQFVSPTTGWVVGANRVLATADAGAHWRTQLHQRGLDLTAVDAIDRQHVWAVGRDVVLASTDGGNTWRRLPEPCASIESVHFVSASRGFAVAGGRLLATIDGGQRWRHLRAPTVVQSVCFSTTRRGWLGAHGKVYRTVDGGRRWRLAVRGVRPHVPPPYPVAEVQCAGAHSGWAEIVGPGAASSQQPHVGYALDDAGSRAIFAERYFPSSTITREAPGSYFGAFSSVDADEAVFVDTCPACGLGRSPVDVATDGGRQLRRAGRVHRLGSAFGAAYVTVADGWVVGSSDHRTGRPTWKVVHTTDGGRSWVTQYVE